MGKDMKLKLDDLRVRSFVTLESAKAVQLKGGTNIECITNYSACSTCTNCPPCDGGGEPTMRCGPLDDY